MLDFSYVSTDGSLPDLDELVSAEVLAIDIEGSGTDMGRDIPYGFSLACKPTSAYYTHMDNRFFTDLLADDNKLKIAHNAKFDRSMFKKRGVIADRWCCTMVAAHLLEEYQLSLKMLMLKHYRQDILTYAELKRPLKYMNLSELAEFSGPHSVSALMLWNIFEKKLDSLKLLSVFWDVEMPLVPVLSDMELNGIMVDEATLNVIGKDIDNKIEVLNDALDYYGGVKGMNHNSPNQVADLLFNKFKITTGRGMTSTGRPSVDKRLLEAVKSRHPYISVYFKFKELKTLKSSYVNSLKKQIINGRIYGSFNQTRTRTSRLSSSDPNLQKIPVRTPLGKKIRTAFIAPEGFSLLKADYDLVELKMMAHCSQDEALLQAFREGRDIHTETAIKLFGDPSRRAEGKTANFQIIYQGGDSKTRAALEKVYPGVFAWTRQANAQAREAGYVRTLGGRIRSIDELWSDSIKIVAHGEREAISTIIQGSSAEVVKVGMAKIWEVLRGSAVKMLLQVHDELVFEVPDKIIPEVVQVIKETMPYHELSLPLTVSVSVGKNWCQMKEI